MGTQRQKPDPEMQKPGQAQERVRRQIRSSTQRCDGERIKVAKPDKQLSRKAAIELYVPVP